MESLLFLLAALVIIAFGTAILALRARQPSGLHHTIKTFEREMRALSPESRRVVHDRTDNDEHTGG